MTEFEEFILAIDSAIKEGARAEQALRAVVTRMAENIRQRREAEQHGRT
jgi:hypothetical protein